MQQLRSQQVSRPLPVAHANNGGAIPLLVPRKPDPDIHCDLPTYYIGNGVWQWAGMVDEILALKLLEFNNANRAMSDVHAERIKSQMDDDKFMTNGDTISFDTEENCANGQHRLWAVANSKKPVWLILLFGIKPEAFSTIDTIRRSRSGSDVLHVKGLRRLKKETSAALSWLIRFQRDGISSWRDPVYRVENADIEIAFHAHPKMVRSVDACKHLHQLVATGLLAFIYYVTASHDQDLADRMLKILDDPTGIPLGDPFYVLRNFLQKLDKRRRDHILIIAVFIKAMNAAHEGRNIDVLNFRSQGDRPESFPQFWFK
jgi:hypothetical protein